MRIPPLYGGGEYNKHIMYVFTRLACVFFGSRPLTLRNIASSRGDFLLK